MASPFTGGLRFWDGIHVAKLRKKVVPAGSAETVATEQDARTASYLIKPGLLEVVFRDGQKPKPSTIPGLDERVKHALSIAAECIQPEELRTLFEKKEWPICYDGFEPSGRMHIAQGIMKALNVNKLTDCGCVFVFWVADWYAMLNNKMGGDLKKIRKVGQYFIHVWKAAGMNLENVRFIWASDEINRDPNSYWMRVMDIAQRNSLSRVKRCGQIMGRQEGDDNPTAQVMYPCMQCADIFYIGADICQLGMDQRKINMLAREYVDDWNSANKKSKLRKPIILSHGMLPGLLEGQQKMSKSDPESAIFMEDSVEDVRRKIKRAFCPPEQIDDNPIIAYIENLVFEKYGTFVVERSEANGGNVTFDNITAFKDSYQSGALHPGDVKPALAKAINQMLQPVRDHFINDPEAKALLSEIKNYKVTK